MTKYFTKTELDTLRRDLRHTLGKAMVEFRADPDRDNYGHLQDAMLNHQDALKNVKREFFKGTVDTTGRFYFIGEPPKSPVAK